MIGLTSNRYHDVGVDFHELASGYRLLLVYNLIQDETQAPQCTAGLGIDQQKVIDALHEWQVAHKIEDLPGPVAYKLEHTYEDEDLELNHLKGRDHVRAQLLQQACQKLGFSLFLANPELAVSGSCREAEYDYNYDECMNCDDDEHHSIVAENYRELQLKGVRCLDGSVYVKGLDFEEDNLLQDDIYAEFPDAEEYDGYDSTTHYCREQCFLLLPENCRKDLTFRSAIKSEVKTKDMLSHLLKSVKEVQSKRIGPVSHASPHAYATSLERFCKIIVTKSTNHNYRSYFIDMIAAAVLLDRHSLFRMIVYRCASEELPLAGYLQIGLVLPFEVSDPVEWLNEVTQQARKSKHLYHQWNARLEVLRGAQTSLQTSDRISKVDINSIRASMYSELDTELETRLPLTITEAAVLAEVALGHPDRDQFLLHTLLPFVVRNIAQKVFVLHFLHYVYVLYEDKEYRKETVVRFYEDVVCALTQILFEVPPISQKRKYQASDHPALKQSETPVIDPSYPGNVATLVGDCQSLGLRCHVEAILTSVVESCGYYPTETF